MGTISLDCSIDGRLIVPMVISHPDPRANKRKSTTGMIDTGADITTLRKDLAVELNLPLVDIAKLSSVSSTDNCPIFAGRIQLLSHNSENNKMEIAYSTRRPISIIGATLPSDFPPCLIGRDIITQGMLILVGNRFVLNF